MLSLNANQLALVADDSKTVRWAFTVLNNVGGSVATPVIMDFSGIELRRNSSENGIIAPSDVTFSISNVNNTLNFLDIKGGTVLIELYLTSPTVAETKIAGWLFRIKTCEPGYQKLRVVAEDFLQQYLQGDYPNTRMVADIFPSTRVYTSDKICVPVIFGTAYIPLRDVYISEWANGETIDTSTDWAAGIGPDNLARFSWQGEYVPFIAAGSTITVSGFANANNNGTFTVAGTGGNVIRCTTLPAGFAAEAPGATVTIAIGVGVGGEGYIVLGDSEHTYTITKVCSPESLSTWIEYPSSNYAFTQYVKTDATSVSWQVFQAIIADSDSDGAMDAPGFFGLGNPMLDPVVEFTKSGSAATTGPGVVILLVLEDMGVSEDNLNMTSIIEANTTFGVWGLAYNGGYWYKQPREKVLSQLLTLCHSCLDVSEKVAIRILSKTSKATITAADVLRSVEQGEGSFSYQNIINTDYSDSGYVAWYEFGKPQDGRFNKVLVDGAYQIPEVSYISGSSSTVISNTVLECPFVQDPLSVQKIGKLDAQRKYQKEAEISFLAPGTRLALQPDDVITISSANYGGTYNVLIDSVKINKDCSIQFVCSKYTNAFNDWDDLTPTELTITTDLVADSWAPTITGATTDINYNRDPIAPRAGIAAGVADAVVYPNELLWASDTETLYIEQDGAKIAINTATTTDDSTAGDYCVAAAGYKLPNSLNLVTGKQGAASYTKTLEFYIGRPGAIRTRLGLSLTNTTGNSYAKIYKNGSAIGTERGPGGVTWQYFDEDFSGLVEGDLIQVYAYSDDIESALVQLAIGVGNPLEAGPRLADIINV